MSAVSKKTKMLVLSAMLTAVAAALSIVDGLIPIQAVVPLPGLKLGLANIVTMFAIFFLGYKYTFAIVIARCLLGGILAGGPVSLAFSLSGATAAAAVMTLMKRGYGNQFSFYGISLAGSAAFNLMQVIIASIILQDSAVFSYLPILMSGGIVTGVLTAVVFGVFYVRTKKTGLIKRYITY